jgi:hypothetical protein
LAKTFALDRSTTQPVTIDTVTTASTSLGGTIAGMETTSLFPARCVNLFTVFGGDPYVLSLSALGNIEIYRLISGVWTLVGGPFTPAVGHVLVPLCLHTVNNQIVAIWSDEAGANDGVSASTTFDGTTWTSPDTALATIGTSNAGHSIVYRGAVWFTTAIGLWAYAPLTRIITLSGIVGSFLPGETVTGAISLTTAIVRSYNSPILRVDTVVGSGFQAGETIASVTGTGTFSSITRFINIAPDTGNDTFLGVAGPGTANLIGSFASWDGSLYFVQPKTALNPIRFYQLDANWESANNVPAPQWTSITVSGIVDVGFATVAADTGLWALFVNRNDELCLFYSGSGSTKLAKTVSKSLPLTFTDLTSSLLPASILSATNLGITLYTDDRRRDNLIQTLLIRDLSGGNTILAAWDGSSSVEITGNVTGANLMLAASRLGQETTFTNLQPAATITAVAQPFPGRVRIDYNLRSNPARTLGIIPEYSLDGDQFFPMTEGDAHSGLDDLPATPVGIAYFFNWDTFADLDGDFDNVLLRIVARITGV